MDQNILSIRNLSHRYATSWAIRDISFEITRPGVIGLLGSNGAGKSTTMNIICGALNQTKGDVWVNGINTRKQPLKAKQNLGFLPQIAPLHMDLTVDEYLRYTAHLRQLTPDLIGKALEDAKEKCGIAHFSKRLIRNLSGGYRQRVGLAQAIIHEPQLVILDEPTNGLDPNQILEIRQLIKDIGRDRCVIFSSHILSEIEATCREIIMIEGGKMVFHDTMEAFNNYIVPNSLVCRFEALSSPDLLKQIHGISSVENIDNSTLKLHVEGDPSIAERIIVNSVQNGWRLTEIAKEKISPDEIFARLSKKSLN